MFPYPSGAGLHVGHVTGYTATDILARYKRQKGCNVLHPMGWDSFGLPAEQYALRTGTHPAVTSEKNIHTYRRQLQALGLSYDWDRECATSDPRYYKWTQWIFTKLCERGLAYEAKIPVNYCSALGTVLSNEEVEDGKSKEGGYPIERRPLKQWILKITDYADRLLEDLDELDWPDYLKRLQRNWIGRSEGAEVVFRAKDADIPVFTTRHDTLFGVTFLVLAPEHPLVDSITTDHYRAEVDAYRQAVSSKSDLERTELAKEKTGVFTGGYCINPISQAEVPVWIADYVLMGYGTGAVMAVPGGDERDIEFAKKYELPVIPIYDPEDAIEDVPPGLSAKDIRVEILAGKRHWNKAGSLINSDTYNGLQPEEAKEAIADWLEQNGAGKRQVSYKLRDWLFSRQRYWGEPFPILHFEDGSIRTLDPDELPLMPPEITDYKPQGDGRSPLAKVADWVEITDPKTGKPAKRETNTMPQWAGSCWYYLRFCDPHNDEAAWGKEAEQYWMSVDMYVGGVEHAVLHLLYARFWHKVLYDCGLVSTKEPFHTLRNQGLVTAKAYKLPEGGYVAACEVENGIHTPTGKQVVELTEKMSKSKLNGVSPDEMVEEYGADSLRLYEMFMAPFDKEKLWNTDAVSGTRRFLDRFWNLVHSDKVSDESSEEALKLGHRLVAGVAHDIESMQFNTAIAKMMEFINAFLPLPAYPKEVLKMAVLVLSPFAPHIAEECWHDLGGVTSLAYEPFPVPDSAYLIDETTVIVVQVNGKVRARLEGMPLNAAKDFVLEQAQKRVSSYLDGEIVKVIHIPNKILNIVIRK